MTGRTSRARWVFLAVALLQLALPGTAALADAQLDAVAPRVPIHLESRATQACVPIHPADCVLHQFLSTPGSVGQRVLVSVRSGAAPPPTANATGLTPSTAQQRLPDSRAPPVSS
jgi:hypothetical protein